MIRTKRDAMEIWREILNIESYYAEVLADGLDGPFVIQQCENPKDIWDFRKILNARMKKETK